MSPVKTRARLKSLEREAKEEKTDSKQGANKMKIDETRLVRRGKKRERR